MYAIIALNGIEMMVLLAIGLAIGLGVAASRGYKMPVAVCLALIVVGGLLVVAPTAFSFLLQALGRQPTFGEDERMPCWVSGAIMCIVGILASIFARRSNAGPPK